MNENVLKNKIHEFIKLIYQITQNFPKHELYGLVAQLRRAAVSVMLNYLEGFARRKPKVILNFYEMSFGSIKECKYILFLSKEVDYLLEDDYNKAINLAEEISAMLWSSIQTTEKRILK